ncbi:helix-turn-helix domain-containing protein [Mucilaginibacter paludis]|uniref:helix-turn-helix domain-containing protein n=1 Tax=Mucilaginibacter paludis TaxID=423351 RepID=UPI0002555BD7|nr:helix-turn-helix domain-containing protein [Mucilaginibacter paludis]
MVIDEVSVVRADLLDMIDLLLKQIRNVPERAFGGVQVLFIGDLFQLSPVLTGDEEAAFSACYSSRYFFDAHVIRQSKVIYIELSTIYRQKDPYFIGLLNKIRHNEIEQQNLDELNRKVIDPNSIRQNQMITLTSHVRKVEEINARNLAELPGEMFTYPAQVIGKFDSKNFPGEAELKIKVGARVMVTKNDTDGRQRFYNGKIGNVYQISDNAIAVVFNEFDEPVLIQKESWKNLSYGYVDEKTIVSTLGELKQFPLRLAWAVTIHKSQGLSFDEAVIDAAESFSEGQVYVALSRLTNFEGLFLSSPISAETLKQSEIVLNFVMQCQAEASPESSLDQESRNYVFNLLISAFSWNSLSAYLHNTAKQIDSWRITAKFDKLLKIEELCGIVEQQQQTSLKLVRLLTEQVSKSTVDFKYITERVMAARVYFDGIIEKDLTPLAHSIFSTAVEDKDQKEFQEANIKIMDLLKHKQMDLEIAQSLASGMMNGLSPEDLFFNYNQLKKPLNSMPTATVSNTRNRPNNKQATQQKTYEYFRTGASLQEIAEKRQLALHVVENHITELIKTGMIKLEEILPPEKIINLLTLIPHGNVDINELKIKAGNKYSFFELRAAINHVHRVTDQSA